MSPRRFSGPGVAPKILWVGYELRFPVSAACSVAKRVDGGIKNQNLNDGTKTQKWADGNVNEY